MGAIPREFIPTPFSDRNLFGLLIELRDPIVFTELPLAGPAKRVLIANSSRVGLRIFNAGVSSILLSSDQGNVFTGGWILPTDREIVFAPPWAPLTELWAGTSGNPCDLRIWELWAK